MNALLWILAIIAYLVFNYLFALLNLWAWKKGVVVTAQHNRKEIYEGHFEESVRYSVRSSGVARILWPFLVTKFSDGSPESSIFSKEDEERARVNYLVLMTIVGSATKAAFLPLQWSLAIFVITAEQLFTWLGRLFFWSERLLKDLLPKLPGAKKVL